MHAGWFSFRSAKEGSRIPLGNLVQPQMVSGLSGMQFAYPTGLRVYCLIISKSVSRLGLFSPAFTLSWCSQGRFLSISDCLAWKCKSRSEGFLRSGSAVCDMKVCLFRRFLRCSCRSRVSDIPLDSVRVWRQ
jgi:hypothetical protein